MSKTELFVFRHGETNWNLEKRFQGHTDIPLNPTGIAQAVVLREIVENCDLDVILSSDLKRARRTADLVNEVLGLPVFESADLRECVLGEPEGITRQELYATYGQSSWDRWVSIKPEDFEFCFPKGEPKSKHLERLLRYLEVFCKSHPRFQRIGVSTHGGCIRRLAHNCVGAPKEPVPLPNCVMYKLSFRHQDKRWSFEGQVE